MPDPMSSPSPTPTHTPGHDLVDVPTNDGPMPAHRWLPPEGSGSGILLLQEIFGVSAYIQQRGAELAAAGFVVLAPELYWRLDGPPLDAADEDLVGAAMSRAQRLDWETTVADAVASLDDLRGRQEVTGGVAVVGFCFGGALAFNVAAVAEVEALVDYYGSSVPGMLDLAPQITAPSLHHFGLADDYIDVAAVESTRAALEAGNGTGTVEFWTYPGANHAFDNWDFPLHDPDASRLAWQRTIDFLGRRLGSPEPNAG